MTSQPQPLKKIRLQKLIAERTPLSRRAAEQAIQIGRVKVNGKVVTQQGTTVLPGADRVSLDGIMLRIEPAKRYVAYYKPKNRIVSLRDPQKRKTIWDDLPRWRGKLNAAGRLDYDAEGLILLSNDGDFLNKITHPSTVLIKTYHAKVRHIPTKDTLAKIEKGTKDRYGKFQPAEIKMLKQEGKHSWLEIKVHEGKYHQIKRMCDSIGHPVVKLKRISVGPITLRGLERGKWRNLSQRELEKLRVV